MEDKEQANCKAEIGLWRDHRQEIPDIVRGLAASCSRSDCFDNVGPEPIPSRDAMIEIVHQLRRIIFPGYFISSRLDPINLEYYLGQETASLFDALSQQIALCIRHDCTRNNLPCTQCEERGRLEAADFIRDLPGIRVLMGEDVRAAYEGDPAAKSYDEIVFCYPGLLAVMVYRLAHRLYTRAIPLMPRIMCEYVHGLTGIDIHPGARIGGSFFIDHGVGVVIGETTEIGNRVRIYQGVTLGALSLPKDEVERLRGKKRHPTIQDDVVIYAGATILGGDTTIGANSVVGGNVWLTESVPPQTRVYIKKPDLVLRTEADE
jgi:serine O-acetyltransferase